MAALLALPSAIFSDIVRSLAADFHLQRRRLAALLLSPLHFSLTLSYLHSLSLSQKALLLARFLLSSLKKLLPSLSGPSASSHSLRLRDLDAALLLMAMCDSYEQSDSNTSRHSDWHSTVSNDVLKRMLLTPAGLGDSEWAAISHYVDAAAKCRRLLEVFQGGGAGEKLGGELCASVAAVVALPSVECRSGGRECVICKEEMEEGRDVCELPCKHWFHWSCVLGWLRKRNTCPCCRYELPTEDVFGEMGRLWRAVARMVGDQQEWRIFC